VQRSSLVGQCVVRPLHFELAQGRVPVLPLPRGLRQTFRLLYTPTANQVNQITFPALLLAAPAPPRPPQRVSGGPGQFTTRRRRQSHSAAGPIVCKYCRHPEAARRLLTRHSPQSRLQRHRPRAPHSRACHASCQCQRANHWTTCAERCQPCGTRQRPGSAGAGGFLGWREKNGSLRIGGRTRACRAPRIATMGSESMLSHQQAMSGAVAR
jgi:hypothetical protein